MNPELEMTVIPAPIPPWQAAFDEWARPHSERLWAADAVAVALAFQAGWMACARMLEEAIGE